ncbi:Glycosyl transferase family 2 [uncultured delta proteobacterium]|uniref:Glycosyl transferase family 2 n=1 Tax=uncultured delta proteobacterium TaxID=34034 RepID=A0A212KE87_9DELT|nr:Glycosyl transferase family 2 [uncultured delta proteobacterium]
MTQTAPEISLVIPVYNEEDNLRALVAEIHGAMARVDRPWEVLFVDDGSTDMSLDILRELAASSPNVTYIALAANSGQSAAFAAGFAEAAGDIIITMDADLQNDPADIPAMLDTYGKNGVTMVVGWRANRKDTLTKRLASRFGNAVRNWISRETIKDTGCSLKVMRRDMVRRLPVFNGVHRFYPTLMRLEGATVAEVKVNHRPRVAGVSKYGIWDRARKTVLDLLAVRWLQSRHVSCRIKERKA